jgi:RimJ/RimL family protein N-acetyltransferase
VGGFEIRLNTKVVGTAQARYLDTLTGGYTHDTAYLAWIAVAERHQGKGIGTEFMKLLVQILLGKGYRYLHTDTASDNVRAQTFYEKLGFQQAGYTRDYVQIVA